MTLDLERYKRDAQEAKERAEKATEGPWFDVVIPKNGCGGWGLPHATLSKAPAGALIQSRRHTCSEAVIGVSNYDSSPWMLPGDREFVAHARTDVPTLANAVIQLVAEVEELNRQIGQWKESADYPRKRR